MSFRTLFRAVAVCTVLTLSVPASAHAQLGSIRRAAQRATGAAQDTPPVSAAPASTQRSAAQSVNTGNVLEMTAPVLDRFQRALDAERADLGQVAQRLSALKPAEDYPRCQLEFYGSAAGQATYAKLSAAAESGDHARMNAAAEEVKAALEQSCGDPLAEERIRREAPGHAEQAAIAAGGFSAREYAVIKERVVPFCRASAATAGQDEVRLPGDGINVFWVYTAGEVAVLRERCGVLMQGMAEIS